MCDVIVIKRVIQLYDLYFVFCIRFICMRLACAMNLPHQRLARCVLPLFMRYNVRSCAWTAFFCVGMHAGLLSVSALDSVRFGGGGFRRIDFPGRDGGRHIWTIVTVGEQYAYYWLLWLICVFDKNKGIYFYGKRLYKKERGKTCDKFLNMCILRENRLPWCSNVITAVGYWEYSVAVISLLLFW